MHRKGALVLSFVFSTLVGCTSILGSFDVSSTPTVDAPDGGGGVDAPVVDAPPGDAPPAPYSVTVTKAGTGMGRVTSAPPGIDCGPTCSAAFPPGMSVTLTAAPLPPSTFTGWSGGCTGQGDCVVAVNAAVGVTATFALVTQTLTVTKSGTGRGTVTSVPPGINCGTVCAAPFADRSAVVLKANPDPGSAFVGWTGGGGCTGAAPQCTANLTAPTTVDAEFATFTTWDPAWSVAGVTYSPDNLSISGNSPTTKNVRTVTGRATGTFYWEIKATGGAAGTNGGGLGILESAMPNNAAYIGITASGSSFGYGPGNSVFYTSWVGVTTNGTPPAGTAVAAGNVYMFALDMTNGRFWAGVGGVWFNGGDPAAATNPVLTGVTGTVYPGVTLCANSIDSYTANFGAQPFVYAVPAGFAPGFF